MIPWKNNYVSPIKNNNYVTPIKNKGLVQEIKDDQAARKEVHQQKDDSVAEKGDIFGPWMMVERRPTWKPNPNPTSDLNSKGKGSFAKSKEEFSLVAAQILKESTDLMEGGKP